MSEQQWGMLLPAFFWLVVPLVLAIVSWLGAGASSHRVGRE